ncbi:MAG: alpha,alpha-trehalose-phosphate synthase (UDP-forming) [Halanaerobiaceae bacterium]
MSKSKNNGKLVLISNGEPYVHEKTKEGLNCRKLPGGLTTGLDPLMKKEKGLWIAWGRGDDDFEAVDESNKVKVPDENGYTLKRIKLTEEELDGFYYGFSNETMWPISHNFIDKANFEHDYWDIYKSVNEKYAEATLEDTNEDDLIWVHDYHLTLLPGLIREKRENAKISLFWHIPWPSWESFSTLPWKKEILEGVLASDFIGFHTPHLVNNFITCAHKLGAKVDRDKGIVTYKGHKTYATAIPLGVDFESLSSYKEKCDIEKNCRDIKQHYKAEKLIFGVDRLDYTKGILERLLAMERLFHKYPEHKGKVTLVQRIAPSRTQVEEYIKMREEINRKISEINGRFQKDYWVPIKYFHGSVPQEELLPYFNAADIGLITPLIDGMNLVSKEYLAVKENGLLILSEFAGAAATLKEALIVNPYNIEEVADTLDKAIKMSDNEVEARYKKLKNRIQKYDINWWRDVFLKKWLEIYEDTDTGVEDDTLSAIS